MSLSFNRIVDVSLRLDDAFGMHTPLGFTRDLQFAVEVLKEYDAPGGAGQIVRGVHMRLHAGTHVDAQAHFVPGGTEVYDLPLATFIGDAVIANVAHVAPDTAITAADLERAVAGNLRPGDRLLIRSDWNGHYGQPGWAEGSPYLSVDAVDWCIAQRVVLVGIDFSHAKDPADAPSRYYLSRALCEHNIVVMAYLQNLDRITRQRVTLIALPLAIAGVESAPVRAVVLED